MPVFVWRRQNQYLFIHARFVLAVLPVATQTKFNQNATRLRTSFSSAVSSVSMRLWSLHLSPYKHAKNCPALASCLLHQRHWVNLFRVRKERLKMWILCQNLGFRWSRGQGGIWYGFMSLRSSYVVRKSFVFQFAKVFSGKICKR